MQAAHDKHLKKEMKNAIFDYSLQKSNILLGILTFIQQTQNHSAYHLLTVIFLFYLS